jgi:hypothetical protein
MDKIMNIEKVKTRFEQMSIDQLAEQIDRHVDEPLELRIIEEVLKSKIGAMVKKAKLPSVKEDTGDATLCPPPIQAPSGAAFESVSRDINSTEAHVDMFGPELKPSPARWLSSDIAKPAVPDANTLPPQKIHGDGVNAESFSGEVVPGLSFVNPGRQEGRAVHIPLASEILEK